MQNFFLNATTIIDFNFYEDQIIEDHVHHNIELFYVLEGSLTFQYNESSYELEADDFLVINSLWHHAYKAHGNVLIACLHISYTLFKQFIDLNNFLFFCNSSIDANKSYGELRLLLKRIFNCYLDKEGSALLYLNSHYYTLLHILARDFLIQKNDSRFTQSTSEDMRINEILNYIHTNYRWQINLQDLANRLFLSTAYLSKYIKKQLGSNFIDYVNSIRLKNAVNEMLIEEKSITKVALNNGFPNPASFNKVFRAVYGTTPTEYLKNRKKNYISKNDYLPKFKNQISEKVKSYLINNPLPEDIAKDSSYVQLIVDEHIQHTYVKHWNKMINLGPSSLLLQSRVQEQLLAIKKELKFTYVRIWDLYSPEMMINISAGQHFNFVRIDRVLDFLVDNGMKPYFELGFKPNNILKETDVGLLSVENPILFRNNQEYAYYVKTITEHCEKRYGKDEVNSWYFEQWYDPRLLDKEYSKEFYNTFRSAFLAIKSIAPKAKVGAAGYNFVYIAHNFDQLLTEWNCNNFQPDFLTLYAYHYSHYEGVAETENTNQISRNPDQIKKFLSIALKKIQHCGIHFPEIHISEWNYSVSSRNYLNDTCFKGAFVMKTILDMIDLVDMTGYWVASDLFSEFSDNQAIINGGSGLVSRDGIHKPAYYAFEFMSRHGNILLGKNDNAMISFDGYYNYFITCHNCKFPNIRFYMMSESEVHLDRLSSLFDDRSKLKFSFKIHNVANGDYQIKIRSISSNLGSVADEWCRLNMNTILSNHEIDYLRNICVPKVSMQSMAISNNILQFDSFLDPQEIQSIHIIHQ